MTSYEVGVDRGILYFESLPGQAWEGLVGITEDPDNSENSRYLDGVKNHHRKSSREFSGSVSAFTYPDVFFENVATQTRRKSFDFTYRILTGESSKIHLVYNAAFSPEGISRNQNDIDPIDWKFSTKAIPVLGDRRSAHLVIDTGVAYSWTIEALEEILYGSESLSPRMPTPSEVFQIFEDNSILKITDNGDGTWTADGPDSAIIMLDDTTFEITWPSAIYIDEVSYTISSL